MISIFSPRVPLKRTSFAAAGFAGPGACARAAGAASAAIVALGTFALSTIVVRGRSRARFLIDAISSAPLVFPGIVLGFAVLQQFLAVRWLPIYGTHWILVFAFVIKFMPYGMRYVYSGVLQLHRELEEAAGVAGASAMTTSQR